MTAVVAEGGGGAVMPPLEFGFVPEGTITALCDLGNWKVRADAIEKLHRLVLDLPDGAPVLPTLPEFVGFLNKLLADPNFKISLTTLQIWDALVGKVGRDARPVIPAVVPTLVKKLGDAKIVVRQANMRVRNIRNNERHGVVAVAVAVAIPSRTPRIHSIACMSLSRASARALYIHLRRRLSTDVYEGCVHPRHAMPTPCHAVPCHAMPCHATRDLQTVVARDDVTRVCEYDVRRATCDVRTDSARGSSTPSITPSPAPR